MRRAAFWLAAVAAAVSCVEKSPSPGEKPDPAYAKTQMLSAEPTPKYVVNANLGDKVMYLGCDVDKTTLKPGDKFTVVHYWKVLNPPGGDYRVFTHVQGTSQKDWINVDSTKMRSSYPTSQWKAGDVFRDEQTITLKGDWTSPRAEIRVGLYRKGQQGDAARMPVVKGPQDGKQAVIAAAIPIGEGPKPVAPAPPPAYVIRKAAGPITVDGKADEASWGTAQATGAFKLAEGSGPVPPTTARLLWDDKHLYVFIDVTDPDVFSSYKKQDDPLWKEDVVELFIDADANAKGYVELQVNPNNAQFDAWFATTRAQPGDQKWTAKMVSKVVVEGTVDNRDDADKGWHVEIAIPLEAVKGADAAMAVKLPPQPGDTWRVNVVRVEKPKGAERVSASAWAQVTMQDFHAVDRLNVVKFGDAEGAIGAAPAAASQPAAPAPAVKGAVVPAAPKKPLAPMRAVPTKKGATEETP